MVAFIVVWVLFGGVAPASVITFVPLAATGTWLLALLIAGGALAPLQHQRPAVLLFGGAVLLVPLAQLVPLPPGIMAELPGRSVAMQSLASVGEASRWRPATLSVAATLESALACWWLAGLAVAVAGLSTDRIRQLFAVLFGLAMANIAIGFVQVLTGGAALALHDSTNAGLAIGFFANKNHSGLFMAIGILAGYAVARRRVGARSGDRILLTPVIVAPVLLVTAAALLATNSRAALLFGVFALGFCTLLAWDRQVGGRTRAIALAALAVIVVVAALGSSDVASRSLGRFGLVDSDLRWLFWQHSLPLIGQFFPVGAGIGTFPTLFMVSEQLGWVKPTYFNHAHNEYLEQLIEIGVAAPILWGLFLLAMVPAALSAWRGRARTDGALAVVAAAVVFIFVVHSIFDYPLRRPGTAVVFAFALAVLWRARATQMVARST